MMMEVKTSAKTVTFGEKVNVITTGTADKECESDYDYVESASSSEYLSSDAAEDAENFEAVVGATFSGGSPSKSRPPPVERESLLLFDSDLIEEEQDLESSESGKFIHYTLLFLVMTLHLCVDDDSSVTASVSTCSGSKCGTESQETSSDEEDPPAKRRRGGSGRSQVGGRGKWGRGGRGRGGGGSGGRGKGKDRESPPSNTAQDAPAPTGLGRLLQCVALCEVCSSLSLLSCR